MFAALTLRRLKFPSRGSDRKIDGNGRHDGEKIPKKYTREIIKDAGRTRDCKRKRTLQRENKPEE